MRLRVLQGRSLREPATLEILRHGRVATLVTVRPYRSRKEYTLPAEVVAAMVIAACARAEAEETVSRRRHLRRRLY